MQDSSKSFLIRDLLGDLLTGQNNEGKFKFIIYIFFLWIYAVKMPKILIFEIILRWDHDYVEIA